MTPPQWSPQGYRRFHRSFQVGRGLVFTFGLLAATILRRFGFVSFDTKVAFSVAASATLTAVLFFFLYSRQVEAKWGFKLSWVWMVLDIAYCSAVVYCTESPESLWFMWYLVNTMSAAFSEGGKAALGVGTGNVIGYMVVMYLFAQQPGSPPFEELAVLGLGRVFFLFSLSIFFIKGISDLRGKRLLIKGLMKEQATKVVELTTIARELDQRTRELAGANLRIQEADQMKSQFLANMSHELRTPLNSIIGFSEILSTKLPGVVEQKHERFINNILSSGRHLLSLINDILDLSKIEAGKMELFFQNTSLKDIAEGVRSVMLGVAGKRGIMIQTQVPNDLPTMKVDGPKLKQVLYNLVSNAVKFSPDKGNVEIIATFVPATDSVLECDSVAIHVRDHGIGISKEQQAHVFEEFRQVDSGSDRQYSGTGLGLALVKKFTELQGGQVILDSEVNRGSTFTVMMPVNAEENQPQINMREALRGSNESDSELPVVLVVEDDDQFFNALAVDLRTTGFQPMRAKNGEEALKLMHKVKPDLITLDLVLPGMDGWETLKMIKKDPEAKEIPVVIVSMVANHELGLALGADDFFLKPLDRSSFTERIRALTQAPLKPGEKDCILVIDDDEIIHELLSEELGQEKFKVVSAQNGLQGIKMAQSHQPAIIILDLMMPGMDGFQVASALQEDPKTREIPVIILTAKDLSKSERKRLERSVSALVGKSPDRRSVLLEAVRKIRRRKPAMESSDE